MNNLKRQIENLESENSVLKDDIKHDKAAKEVRELYEAEKWKNLAEISSLKQKNEALKEVAKDSEEISSAFKVDYDELERYKKEIVMLKKEKDENKKDKKILSLERKLLKAQAEIKKLQLGRDITEDTDIEFEEAYQTFSTPYSMKLQNKSRFPILCYGKKAITVQRRIEFSKKGSLLYSDIPFMLGKKPVISESSHKSLSNEQENFEFLALNSEQQQKGVKRKYNTVKNSPRKKKKEACSPTPENRLELKELHAPVSPMKQDTLIVTESVPNIRKLRGGKRGSPRVRAFATAGSANLSRGTDSGSEQEISRFDEDSEPLKSSTPCQSSDVEQSRREKRSIHEASLKLKSSLKLTANIGTNIGTDEESPNQAKPKTSDSSLAKESCYRPSNPEVISENGSTGMYYNPNPSKSRKAHKRLDQSVIQPVKDEVKSPLRKKAIPVKHKRVENNMVELKKPSNTILEPGASARARILHSGLNIEVIVVIYTITKIWPTFNFIRDP